MLTGHTGMKLKSAYRIPEKLAEDTRLSAYAKQLALVLFSLADQNTGVVCCTQRSLARLSKIALSTVNQKLRELEKAGYITVKKQHAYFDRNKNRPAKRADVYICNVPERGYLLIPYRILQRLCTLNVHGSQIAVFLYVYRMMRLEKLRRKSSKKELRAYPSFSMIARNTGHADSTIRAALSVLVAIGLLHTERCLMRSGAYSCNSYFLLHETRQVLSPARIVAQIGTPKFKTNRVKSKITSSFTRGEKLQRGCFSCGDTGICRVMTD